EFDFGGSIPIVGPELPDVPSGSAGRAKPARSKLQRLRAVPGVSVYGLLLTDSADHPICHLIRQRWNELHHLTGSKFLLIAFEAPKEFTAGFKADWKRLLGDKFDETWKYWDSRQPLEPGRAHSYLDEFAPLSILLEYPASSCSPTSTAVGRSSA